ncbi:helix-turn-helix domain-containing protein [Nocardioides nanhaiensis]|uniref:PucR family transcriptional regulator n=1 Tax=Nocardioides nanhaiensis TaxID=1476871 RepID=A0ABP8VQB8_9ACTN
MAHTPADPSARRTAGHALVLTEQAAAEIRAELPSVADAVVAAIIAEVPSYEDAFSGPMGATINNAVQVALGGFLSLATRKRGVDPQSPNAPATQGAYQLGRGEARGGRTTDALLAAYRIGARVAWQRMSASAVVAGLDARTVASFAGLIFAYIDELSAASVAGHADESATSGRVRARLLDRVARHLLEGAAEEVVQTAAEHAGWAPPTTLTAVVLREAAARPVLAEVSPQTLQVAETPGLEDTVLLVPDAHGRRRAGLLRAVQGRDAVVGPGRPWLAVRGSYERAVRAHGLGLRGDTDEHLVRLVVGSDAEALADLRARVLAPLEELRPASAEKLVDTLRAWLLLQGRREEVAEALFVHPQTVRYRMGQVRELLGDRLDDPEEVLRLVVALAVP